MKRKLCGDDLIAVRRADLAAIVVHVEGNGAGLDDAELPRRVARLERATRRRALNPRSPRVARDRRQLALAL
jgi:hypothetical protein